MNSFRLVRSASAAGLLAIVVAACSSAGTTPSPSATLVPTASPTPTASATASGIALPSLELPRNATELEALLPDTLGGAQLTKFSMKGSDFVSQSNNAELKSWLNGLGKSLNDVSAAYAFDISGGSQTGIFAFRVNGVDHDTLLNGLKQAMQTGDASASWSSATVGGKSVFKATASGETTYLYGTADLVFFVVANDAATAADALSALP